MFVEKYPWWNDAQKKLADEARIFVDEVMPLAEEDAWNRRYPWRIAKEIGKRGGTASSYRSGMAGTVRSGG